MVFKKIKLLLRKIKIMIKGDFKKVNNWLIDAPMFIDAIQLDRFFDSVVEPESRITAITKAAHDDTDHKHGIDVEGSIEGGIPVIGKGKVKTGYTNQTTDKKGKSKTIAYELIESPERQLKKLIEHYQKKIPDRLFCVENPEETEWRKPEVILKSPRSIVFLDLPAVKLIPTAAEFENGDIVLIYNNLKFNDQNIPKYPEKEKDGKSLSELRKEYWSWFDQNFSATKAMIAVEKATKERGRIRWIDYRLPITSEGDTLHLHLQPAGEFDTGVFAYNFIKRGFKHGLRLVGTLKSEPDMNVLAIYEK